MIRAGLLRERIVIQNYTETRSSSGAQLKTWVKFAERHALVRPSMGREQFDLAHTKAEQIVRFTLRYLSGVTEQMRILYGGRGYANGNTDVQLEALGYRMYSINSVADVAERRHQLDILATLERK